MAFKQQQTTAGGNVKRVTSRDWPDPPEFPEELSRGNLQAYRGAMAEWWETVKGLLRSVEEDLEKGA